MVAEGAGLVLAVVDMVAVAHISPVVAVILQEADMASVAEAIPSVGAMQLPEVLSAGAVVDAASRRDSVGGLLPTPAVALP